MAVRNLMEEIVAACMKELNDVRLAASDEKLLSDVMAITLNRLPPKYVSTHIGEVFAKTQLRAQVESDVLREISNALVKVLDSPRNKDF